MIGLMPTMVLPKLFNHALMIGQLKVPSTLSIRLPRQVLKGSCLRNSSTAISQRRLNAQGFNFPRALVASRSLNWFPKISSKKNLTLVESRF